MILDNEKQEAWMALAACIVLSPIRWPDHLSQEQIDYLLTSINRKAFPGLRGRKRRSIERWDSLDFAFAVLKAREPNKSDRHIFDAVAKHYGCKWRTVQKAKQEIRKQEFSFAGRHKELGFANEDFAQMALPHINFDNFPDE